MEDRSDMDKQLSMSEQPALRTCPDCGAQGTGNYCANCGEEMEPRVLRIRHYIRDVFQELLSLDSKFLQSIPALLFRPGFLATEFVGGRRKRYLSPLRLHIIIAILLFLSLSYMMRTRMEYQSSTPTNRQSIDSVLSVIRKQSAAEGDTVKIPTIDEAKRTGEYVRGMATEIGPYVLLFSSTPAFALCLALLYRKRKKLFVEHLMFSLYFFSFAYLILIPPILWFPKILFPISAIVLCVYLFLSIRKFYDDRGFGLVVRSLACIISCAFIGVFAFILSYGISWGIGMALGNLPTNWHGSIHFN